MRWGIVVAVVVLAAALLAPLLARADSGSAPRPITLEQALQMASSTGLEIKAADDVAAAARAQARGTEAHLLPLLKGDVVSQDWSKGYFVSIAPGAPSFEIYSKHTTTTTLQALQPLTGLYDIGEASHAAAKAADAAQLDAVAAREETMFRTTEAYLRLLEQIDLEAITGASVKDLEESERTTKSLVTAGSLIQVDLLKVQVALAQARQNELAAKARAGIAQAVLDAAIGLPTDTALLPARLDPASMPTMPPDVHQAVSDALSKRPELRAQADLVTAANSLHRAAVAETLPSLAALAQYQNFQGFGFIQPKHSEFVGVDLSWNFWDWGAKYRDAQILRSRARVAADRLAAARIEVSTDVTSKYLIAQSAFAAIQVAHSAVAQAEEEHRVTESLYQNGGATTKDVLDAQVALEQARTNDTTVAYEYRIYFAAFQRAAAAEAK